MSVKSFQINSLAQRAGLIVCGLLCLTFLFFAARWYFGNSIALRAGYKEVAEFAVALAPNDPQTHYAVAIYNEKTFLPEDLQKSLAEYEQATTPTILSIPPREPVKTTASPIKTAAMSSKIRRSPPVDFPKNIASVTPIVISINAAK